MTVLGGAAAGIGRPPTVRFEDATLSIATSSVDASTDASPEWIGPLAVTADADAITFSQQGEPHHEEDHARALPWHRVLQATVGERAGAAELLLQTERVRYHVRIPGQLPPGVASALSRVVPPGTRVVTVDGAEEDATSTPPGDGAAATAGAQLTGAQLTGAQLTGGPEPPAPPAVHPPAGARRGTRPSPVFDKVRPVLAVVLAIAVATMVALVLADSMGAIHLSWLGGTGSSVPIVPGAG